MKTTSGYPSGLTAHEVAVLIECYWNPDAVPEDSVTRSLLYAGLIDEDGELVERGLVFVRHLLESPLPTRAWTMGNAK